MAKQRQRRQRQGYLETMEPPRLPELESAAEDYADKRDARMAKWEKEKEAQAVLKELMDRHELKVYELPDGRKVEVVPGEEKVKVRRPKPSETLEV